MKLILQAYFREIKIWIELRFSWILSKSKNGGNEVWVGIPKKSAMGSQPNLEAQTSSLEAGTGSLVL